MKTTQFEVITLDVWGNEEEGFEVNDAHSTGEFIEIGDNDMSADVVEKLLRADWLSEKGASIATVEWHDDGFIEIARSDNGKPLFHLIAEGV